MTWLASTWMPIRISSTNLESVPGVEAFDSVVADISSVLGPNSAPPASIYLEPGVVADTGVGPGVPALRVILVYQGLTEERPVGLCWHLLQTASVFSQYASHVLVTS